MAITINLAPEVEERLRSRAATEGKDIAQIVQDLLADEQDQNANATNGRSADEDAEKWVQEFDAEMEEISLLCKDVPLIDPMTYSDRSVFYEED